MLVRETLVPRINPPKNSPLASSPLAEDHCPTGALSVQLVKGNSWPAWGELRDDVVANWSECLAVNGPMGFRQGRSGRLQMSITNSQLTR